MVSGGKAGREGDVQSVHRALDLLETIADHGETGVGEVARATGLNSPTAHNLLKTLMKRGYLISSGGRYRLGPAASVLTSRFDPILALPGLVKPVVARAYDELGVTVFAYVLVGQSLQCIGVGQASELPGEALAQAWGSKPVLLSAGGRVLLAVQPEAAWGPSIDPPPRVDTEPDWTTAQWREHLRTVAATGLCAKCYAKGSAAVGVPVCAGGGGVIAALATSVLSESATPELLVRMVDTLWAATTALSAELGCAEFPYAKPTVPDDVLEDVRNLDRPSADAHRHRR